jgi:hypothetical protein
MSVTAADAAEKALGWAEAAELGLKQVDEHRMQARRYEGARDNEAALQHRTTADGFEVYRERAVVMATMWAHVAGALQATEAGGRS